MLGYDMDVGRALSPVQVGSILTTSAKIIPVLANLVRASV